MTTSCVERSRTRRTGGRLGPSVLALLGAAAVFCGCAGAEVAENRVQTEGSNTLEPGPLGLKNEDFWNEPHLLVAPMRKKLMMKGTPTLAFDAPTEVLIDGRETLPAQVVRIAPSARMRERPFPTKAIVVGVDPEENTVRAALALRPTERETSPAPAPSVPPPAEGMGAESFTIDLRERLQLPWEPSLIQTRLIIWDEASPARPVVLKNAGFQDPEVARFRAEQRAKTNVPELSPPPGEPWASYKRDKNTPATPEKRGIALSVARVFPMDEGEPCVLRGAFRLPILKRHVIPASVVPKPGTEDIFAQLAARVKAGEPMPTGVVPITLVAVGSEVTGPMVWRLVVPTFDKVDPAAEPAEVTGTFAIDLRTLEGFDGRAQTWFIYAFSSDIMVGPTPVALTARPSTP